MNDFGPHGGERHSEEVQRALAEEGHPFEHIDNPRQRQFLVAYAIMGRKNRALKVTGISSGTLYGLRWRTDERFQEAVRLAEEMVADLAEDEVFRRGVEGLKRYRFNKDGDPLIHPETGAPYYEHEYSDKMLELLVKAVKPEKFGTKVAVRSLAMKVDLGRLPDAVVARVAEGEALEAVLVSILEGGGPEAEEVRRMLPASIPQKGREIVQGDAKRPPPGEDGGQGGVDDGLGEDL